MSHAAFQKNRLLRIIIFISKRMKEVLLIIALVFFHNGSASANNRSIDLTALSIEELMDIEITSVSRKPQKIAEAASAVYVISQEDIRRSGLTSIPEILRMAPGLHVAQITSSKWAITSRGFNDLAANFLLVLVDGINVYSPTFGGVNWDEVDTLLDDIERIEVIRGPGATMWGAAAVNGVINITTKNANDTKGGKLSVGGGNYEQGFGSVRYGDSLGEDAAYRVYVKYFNRDSYHDSPGEDTSDRWYAGRGGFRMDWNREDDSSLTVQGDFYSGDAHETLTRSFFSPPYMETSTNTLNISGGNILTRWNKILSDTSDIKLQLYYYRTVRDDVLYRDTLNRFDVDFQHRFQLGWRHDVVWGLRYNFEDHDLRDSPSVTFDPDTRQLNLFSGFIQDEIVLFSDQLHLILGTKVEHNHYTGFEVQPSGRLWWKPHENHNLWIAISRAVKTPNRINRDFTLNWVVLPLGIPWNIVGLSNRDYDSEEVTAYEFGYRSQLSDWFFIDLAAFYTDYHDLGDLERGNLFFAPNPFRIVAPRIQVNAVHGHTYGTEMSVNYQVVPWWKLVASYTLLKLHVSSHVESEDTPYENGSPENQFQIRSYLTMPCNMEFDSALYYVDHIGRKDIPSYVRLDARIGWKPNKNMDISFVLQNLLDDHHPEYTTRALGLNNSEVTRTIYLKTTWLF
jgi:iron complex outermembrane receptor protein